MKTRNIIIAICSTILLLNSCKKDNSQGNPEDAKYIRITQGITNQFLEKKYETAYNRFDEEYKICTSFQSFESQWNDFNSKYGNLKKVKLSIGPSQNESYKSVNAKLTFEKSTQYADFLFSSGSIYPLKISYSNKKPDTKKKTNNPESNLKDLCSDYFRLGTGLTGYSKETCAVNLPKYMDIVKNQFNSCTLTNLMKPSYILDQKKSQENLKKGNQEPALNYNAADPTLKWCYENGVQMRGHTLVWHTQAPDWFFTEDYTSKGVLVSRDIMIERMDSMIKQYMTYVQETYPGVVYCWDVVNESVDPRDGSKDSFFRCRIMNDNQKNLWYFTIGEDYPEQAFISARKYAAPGVSLFYNDYGTTDKTKRECIYKLCEDLKSKGLIDGIGMQGYWDNKNPSLKNIAETINYYAQLGLEIQITEWSIDAESYDEKGLEKQAERYASVFRLLQKLDTQGGGNANITCVSFFGVMDGYPLYQNDKTTCRIFDKYYKPKPAYYRIKDTMELFY